MTFFNKINKKHLRNIDHPRRIPLKNNSPEYDLRLAHPYPTLDWKEGCVLKKALDAQWGIRIKEGYFYFNEQRIRTAICTPLFSFGCFLFYSLSFRSGNGLLFRPIRITKKDPVLSVCFRFGVAWQCIYCLRCGFPLKNMFSKLLFSTIIFELGR